MVRNAFRNHPLHQGLKNHDMMEVSCRTPWSTCLLVGNDPRATASLWTEDRLHASSPGKVGGQTFGVVAQRKGRMGLGTFEFRTSNTSKKCISDLGLRMNLEPPVSTAIGLDL